MSSSFIALLVSLTEAAAYVNNYNESNNAYGVKLPKTNLRANSFAFMIADFGLPPQPGIAPTNINSCCQTNVADLMRTKRAELEAAGKTLLFVAAGGDNFCASRAGPRALLPRLSVG